MRCGVYEVGVSVVGQNMSREGGGEMGRSLGVSGRRGDARTCIGLGV